MPRADTRNLPYVTDDETTYFIQFIIKVKVCKVEVGFKHSVEAYIFMIYILQDANRTGFYKVSMSTENIIHANYII